MSNVTPEKTSKILPSTSSANSTPPSALSLLRRKMGGVSSPSGTSTSAFSLKIRTPQKYQESKDSSALNHQKLSDTTISTDCQSQLQLVTTLGSSVSIAAATHAMMAVQSSNVGLNSGLVLPSSNVMPFIPNVGQFPALNNGLGNYPLYAFQQQQQAQPFPESFYQQNIQQLQRQNLSAVNQQSLQNPIMMFPVAGSSNMNICQSSPTLTPSGTPQLSSNQQFAMRQRNSTGSLNNSCGSNISSPAPLTPYSATPTTNLQFSGEKNSEIQQLQAKGVDDWTVNIKKKF